ncbi:hypothetical protein [Nocardia sp. NBC_00511]|uniref:MmyB family transcriptional regulator n=1 Tax=Nocardia sp. NBC_00511 TaxID=2903591 RepID=UPI0038707442
MPQWESAARAVLGQLRDAMGRRPGDPRLTELVAGLTAESPEFDRWWSEYPVARFADGGAGPRHAGGRRSDHQGAGGGKSVSRNRGLGARKVTNR